MRGGSTTVLPYRGTFGAPRPGGLQRLALPPAAMPGRHGARPLKAWRYLGVFGSELMICLASVRIGPARQSFWAVWDRRTLRLRQRTRLGAGDVELRLGGAAIRHPDVRLDLNLEETPGIETVCASGESYGWTRKQGGVRATGVIELGDGDRRAIDARAIIDDTAAYYERHTHWRWSAGVGEATDGRALAWNVVDGVNDPPRSSERTLWIGDEVRELPAMAFAADLSAVGELRFRAEAERKRNENRLLVRSRYRQPFGTFDGRLPGDIELRCGYGVMEDHDVWW